MLILLDNHPISRALHATDAFGNKRLLGAAVLVCEAFGSLTFFAFAVFGKAERLMIGRGRLAFELIFVGKCGHILEITFC